MVRIRHPAEQIIGKLREAEVQLSQGVKVAEVARGLGVPVQTYKWWRKENGGLKTERSKRFKEFEDENERLQKLVADPTLDKALLQEIALGNFSACIRSAKRYAYCWITLVSPRSGLAGYSGSREHRSGVSSLRVCATSTGTVASRRYSGVENGVSVTRASSGSEDGKT